MGMAVNLTLNPGAVVQLAAARRRGLKQAGELILAASDVLAPREDVPRHGVHMTETGFTRVEITPTADRVAVGYTAYWAVWQHEDLTYHHEHGVAKFLEVAMLHGNETALALVATAMQEALAQ